MLRNTLCYACYLTCVMVYIIYHNTLYYIVVTLPMISTSVDSNYINKLVSRSSGTTFRKNYWILEFSDINISIELIWIPINSKCIIYYKPFLYKGSYYFSRAYVAHSLTIDSSIIHNTLVFLQAITSKSLKGRIFLIIKFN